MADSISCGFDELALLDSVSISLADGDCLQLSGANGSGKTTLLRSIAGMLPLVSGELSWRGVEVNESNSDYWSSSLFISHRDAIYPNLSVIDNLAWQFNMRGSHPSKQQLAEYLGHFALDDYAASYSNELSFGQRRKLQLAYLQGSSEPLWLLDEPFTSLDTASQAALAQTLAEHQARGGMCIFSSHQSAPAGFFVVNKSLSL